MRVRQHDQVDPPLPRQEAAAEQREQPSRIRATVDEHDHAAELQQERIALTHVERAHSRHGRGRSDEAGARDDRSEHDARGSAGTRPERR